MNTQTHTLILSTPRIEMPDNPNVIEMVNEMVHNNLCNIEYFGGELDNQADYVDESEQLKINSTTYLTIHFDLESSNTLDYNSSEESVLNKMLTILMENQIREVLIDEKDMEIYIY